MLANLPEMPLNAAQAALERLADEPNILALQLDIAEEHRNIFESVARSPRRILDEVGLSEAEQDILSQHLGAAAAAVARNVDLYTRVDVDHATSAARHALVEEFIETVSAEMLKEAYPRMHMSFGVYLTVARARLQAGGHSSE